MPKSMSTDPLSYFQHGYPVGFSPNSVNPRLILSCFPEGTMPPEFWFLSSYSWTAKFLSGDFFRSEGACSWDSVVPWAQGDKGNTPRAPSEQNLCVRTAVCQIDKGAASVRHNWAWILSRSEEVLFHLCFPMARPFLLGSRRETLLPLLLIEYVHFFSHPITVVFLWTYLLVKNCKTLCFPILQSFSTWIMTLFFMCMCVNSQEENGKENE